MNQIDKTDKDLRQLFQKELPGAAENPWFTRKVLNRLPEKRHSPYRVNNIILICLMIGVLLAAILYSVHIFHKPTVMVGDLIYMGVFLLSFLGVSAALVAPLSKN